MKAVYNSRIYTVGSDTPDAVYLDGLAEPVHYSDPNLIIDPTDDEVAGLPWAGEETK